MGQKEKINSQINTASALKWLIENPIPSEGCRKYVLAKVLKFMTTSREVVVIEEETKTKQWTGIIPYLCLIHCLCDHDEVKVDADKAKLKLYKLKNDLLYVKSNWENLEMVKVQIHW